MTCRKRGRLGLDPVINLTTDDMTSEFEFFSKIKMNNIYLTEIMWTCWLHMLDEYWDKKDTPSSDDFGFWPDWLFQYYNELLLGEAIKSSYPVWEL